MKWTLAFLIAATIIGYSQAAHTEVGVAPSFNSEQEDVVVFATNADGSNSDLSLQCDVSGTPTPTVTWYRGDDVVDASFVLSNGTFLFQNITKGDYASTAGVIYHCEATNTIGEPGFIATIRSRDITVHYAFFGGFMPAEEERTFIPTAPAVPLPGMLIGIDIALECRVGDSQPPPDIVWFQDDFVAPLVEDKDGNAIRFLEGGRWAYIRDIETFPHEYHCEVSNARMNGSERSPQTYFVNGTGLDETNFVYKEIGDLTALSTDNFEFSYVSSEGTANRACLFYFNGVQIPALGAVGAITNLLPPPPSLVTLQCRSNQVNVVSSGTVTVQQRAMIMMDPLDSREVIVGSSSAMPTSFSCANTGFPAPSTVWYFNGDRVDSSFVGIVFDDTMLTIENPQVSHSGVYQCFVSNIVSEDNAAWLLEVRAPVAPIALAFNETAIAGAMRDRQVGTLFMGDFGTMVTVPVSVEADPCPSVQWSFKGSNIANGDKYTITNPCSDTNAASPFTFMLTVTNLTNETSGAYFATFSNLAGSGSLSAVYITIPVATSDPISSLSLSVIDNPAAMCLLNASTVTMTCQTNGFPRPEVKFLMGRNIITPGEGNFLRVSQTFADQIQLSDIVTEDAGIYRCERSSESIEFAEEPFVFCTEPFVTNFSSSPNTIEGAELEVDCEIMGIPTPTITWLKGGNMLSSGEDISIVTPSGNLFLSRVTIDSATSANAGTYTCVGTNPAGTVTRDISVEVNAGLVAGLSLAEIIGIAAGGAGFILVIVLIILLLVCVYMCARSSKSVDLAPYNVSGGKSYTDYSADPRGNVDRDSDEEDVAQPEAFSPEYESLPALRPAAPPMYKPTPNYPHGAPLGGDDIEMMKVPPPDTDSFVGAPAYRRDNGDYRPSPDDFLSEDAQFV
ncbi:hemicentin-1-like [Halichondria panicea]|uniref:hemicentin-1-like n=1 Tax=Halichondria panicea TaxID=6063 RepID=UPI00312BAB6D